MCMPLADDANTSVVTPSATHSRLEKHMPAPDVANSRDVEECGPRAMFHDISAVVIMSCPSLVRACVFGRHSPIHQAEQMNAGLEAMEGMDARELSALFLHKIILILINDQKATNNNNTPGKQALGLRNPNSIHQTPAPQTQLHSTIPSRHVELKDQDSRASSLFPKASQWRQAGNVILRISIDPCISILICRCMVRHVCF